MHPVRQKATQVFFACALGAGVLALVEPRAVRHTAFTITAWVLALVGVCAVIAYIRPRGLAAFVVSTALAGLAAVHVAHMAALAMAVPGWMALSVALAVGMIWLIVGLRNGR
jgi:hypothetical protein